MCPESTAGQPSSFVAPQPSGPRAKFRPRPRCPVPPLWPRLRARAGAKVADVPLLSGALLGCLGRGRRIPMGSMPTSRRPGAGTKADLAIAVAPLDAGLAVEAAPLTPTWPWHATAVGRARLGPRARRRPPLGEHARPPPGEGGVSGRRARGAAPWRSPSSRPSRTPSATERRARREWNRGRRGVSSARQDRRQITAVEAARSTKWHEMWHEIGGIAENPWYH